MISRHQSKSSDRAARVELTPAQARKVSAKPSSPSPDKSTKKNGNTSKTSGWFRRFADSSAAVVGSPWSFGVGLFIVLVWGFLGPVFHYSDTWQLVINTGSSIVTFLIVFLIQSTQNRDTKVIQLKLDELLRGVKGARNTLIDLEKLSDEELTDLQREFELLRKRETRRQPPPDDE